MMDAKEARDLLILENAGAARDRKGIQANAMAILALERRIPKRVEKLKIPPYYNCPACGGTVTTWGNGTHHPFCKWCGQAIDWGDEE